MVPVIARTSVLGFIVGVLPGAGATIASFLAYGMEQRIAGKTKGKLFGKGSVRGLTAPECANNAACSGSFVPPAHLVVTILQKDRHCHPERGNKKCEAT